MNEEKDTVNAEAILRVCALAAAGAATAAARAENIERTVLRNGLDLVLVQRNGVPLVTLEIAVRAGAFIETPELDGLTHLHEHMFFKANQAIPDQASYLRRLDDLGASWNGSTSHEVVRYYFTLPAELLRDGLVFLRDAIQSPLFLAEELEKERKVVIGEYDRAEANPLFHLRRAVELALFSRHFSRKNVIGSREMISTATREKLQFIQDDFYVPNNSALIISGQFDAGEVRRVADEVFGGWGRRPDPFVRNPVPTHPPLAEDRYLVVEKDTRTSTILLGWHGPSVDRDMEGAVAADVIADALNHPASRFQRELVDTGLARRANFSYYTLKHIGPIHLMLDVEPAKALAALQAARRELDRLADPGSWSADELTRAAQRLITQDAFGREKSREFAIALGFWWSVGGIEGYLEYPDRARAVTPALVAAFARRYLPAGGARSVVGILVSSPARKEHGINEASLAAAYLKEASAKAAAEAPEERISRFALPNGVEFLSRRIPGGDVAAFSLYFRHHWSRSKADEAGLEQLLLQTLVEGIERRQADELARLGAMVRFTVIPDFSAIGVQCLKAGLDRAVAIVALGLREMEPTSEDVERNRAILLEAYARSLDNPDLAVGFVANRSFYPSAHPYLGYPGGTADSLPRLTREQLLDRRKQLLIGSRILAVAVGDLKLEEGKALVRRSVGDLPAGEPAAAELPPLAGEPGILTTEERGIPTCYVLGKFRGPAPGEADYESLSLALAILHRKMFLEVRTKRALTYAVASGLGERVRNAGQLYVTTTQPNEALSVMYATIDGLIAQHLDEEEFQGHLRTYETRQYLRQESAMEQAASLAQESMVARDFRRVLHLRDRLDQLKPADIQRVLRQYVRGVHFGVVGPKELIEKLDRKLFTSR